MKIGNVFLLSLSPFLILTRGKETKESQAPAGGAFSLFAVSRGRAILARIGFFYLLGK